MADTKISALVAGAPAQVLDKLPAARSGANVALTVQELLAAPLTHSVSKTFTPAGTTTWYRLGVLPAKNTGQCVDLFLFCLRASGSGHHHMRLRLSKATTGATTPGWSAEFESLGLYLGLTTCVAELRIVDGGANQATYVDVRFAEVASFIFATQAVDHVAIGDPGSAWQPDANFTSQGTAAAGTVLDTQTYERAWGNATIGWHTFSYHNGAFSMCKGAPALGGALASLGANVSVDLLGCGNSALHLLRQDSDGGAALVLHETGLLGVTIVSDPYGRFASADPGPGGNKIVVNAISGNTLRLTNRYSVTKQVTAAAFSLFGNPHG